MKLEGISSILALACWSSWNIWLRGAPWKFNSEFTPENTPSPKKKGEQSSNHNFSRAILNFGVNFGVYFLNDFLIFFGIQWFHHFAPLSLSGGFIRKQVRKQHQQKINSYPPDWIHENHQQIDFFKIEFEFLSSEWLKMTEVKLAISDDWPMSHQAPAKTSVHCCRFDVQKRQQRNLLALSPYLFLWWNDETNVIQSAIKMMTHPEIF